MHVPPDKKEGSTTPVTQIHITSISARLCFCLSAGRTSGDREHSSGQPCGKRACMHYCDKIKEGVWGRYGCFELSGTIPDSMINLLSFIDMDLTRWIV